MHLSRALVQGRLLTEYRLRCDGNEHDGHLGNGGKAAVTFHMRRGIVVARIDFAAAIHPQRSGGAAAFTCPRATRLRGRGRRQVIVRGLELRMNDLLRGIARVHPGADEIKHAHQQLITRCGAEFRAAARAAIAEFAAEPWHIALGEFLQVAKELVVPRARGQLQTPGL